MSAALGKIPSSRSLADTETSLELECHKEQKKTTDIEAREKAQSGVNWPKFTTRKEYQGRTLASELGGKCKLPTSSASNLFASSGTYSRWVITRARKKGVSRPLFTMRAKESQIEESLAGSERELVKEPITGKKRDPLELISESAVKNIRQRGFTGPIV